jgi:ankyrin repeat protein
MPTLDLRPFSPLFGIAFGVLSAATAVPPPLAASPYECQEMAQRYYAGKGSVDDRQINIYLLRATGKSCLDLARALLNEGASVHVRGRDGGTPLHQAAKVSDASVARLLLDRGADIEARELTGATPLYHAIDAGRAGTAALLLDRGADPNGLGKSAAPPLAVAAFNGHDRIVALLLERKADPDLSDSTGKTAIIYAAARGFAPIVDRLLAAGIDVNRRYGHDLTALMWAAGHANDVPEADGLKIVDTLLTHGARIDDIDDRGRTALMIAAEVGRPAVIELLRRRGADVGIKDRLGMSAADLAADDEVRKALGL